MAKPVSIAPSLICADQCRLGDEVKSLEKLGVDYLHIDLIDGHFSPSMPLGLEAVKQLRSQSRLPFDVHLMVTDNVFFIREMVKIGVQRLCFHFESEPHVDRWLGFLRENGIQPGIALKPATPLSVLKYILPRIDFVLLMLINPGFAGHRGQAQVPYARRRVAQCRRFLDRHNAHHVSIQVDGRICFETIPGLVAAGAEVLVAGTQSLFSRSGSRQENLARMRQALAKKV